VKAQLPVDFPLPTAWEPVTLALELGDFLFIDSSDNADKSSQDANKGGYAVFSIGAEGKGKPIESVQFKWNAKRQLIVKVKGAPPADPFCGVTNVLDLTDAKSFDNGRVSGSITACAVTFGESTFSLPTGTSIDYAGKKTVADDGLVSWNVTGRH